MATAVFSVVLVVATSKLFGRVSPGTWVPAAYAAVAVLVMAEWAIVPVWPRVAAPTLYLLVSGAGPLLVSGFWLMATERFDPHTAKKVFGLIGAAGTAGGLLAGVAAAQVATIGDIGAMLPLLAALNLACAWLMRRLAFSFRKPLAGSPEPATAPARSGLRVLADTRYLRDLAVLVLLGAVAATFVGQAFMTHVKASLGPGPHLGSFFAVYHAALSLIIFVIQAGGSRRVLEKLGLGVAAVTPAITVLIGGAAAILMPGLNSLMVTCAAEAAVRASIYRAGYEVFYTPVAASDRRAVKSTIDVGVDRIGDIVGAAITQRLLWIPQPGQTTLLLALAMACAGLAVAGGRRLARGYADTLEKSLLGRAVELDLSDIDERTTRTTIMRALSKSPTGPATLAYAPPPSERLSDAPLAPAVASAQGADVEAEVQQIIALHSRDPDAILPVLRSDRGLSAALVAHVIPLLAWDAVSHDCIRALRSIAEEHVGELIDALTNPNQPFVVRRRLARVLSVCVSQRAVDGLLLGLEDLRFEVRYQCARSLLAIVERNAAVRIDKARVLSLVTREISVNRHVWESRRLLDDPRSDQESFLEELVSDRASQSLAHVFTLLATVLPCEPLRIAFRALHTDDEGLRGTALEYLEHVLPQEIRDRLWPFLEDRRPTARTPRSHEDTLAGLLRSHDSIMINLEELRNRASAAAKGVQ
jgi:AAA family ATP:ADP antiporter